MVALFAGGGRCDRPTAIAHACRVEGLTKDYPGVRAVDDVSFTVERCTVHCLVGENGAGKSTLVKMLTGALQPTSGTMTVDGAALSRPAIPTMPELGGIATLFQELHVVDQLTVQENLTLGMERHRFGFLMRSDLDAVSSRRWSRSSPRSIPRPGSPR